MCPSAPFANRRENIATTSARVLHFCGMTVVARARVVGELRGEAVRSRVEYARRSRPATASASPKSCVTDAGFHRDGSVGPPSGRLGWCGGGRGRRADDLRHCRRRRVDVSVWAAGRREPGKEVPVMGTVVIVVGVLDALAAGWASGD